MSTPICDIGKLSLQSMSPETPPRSRARSQVHESSQDESSSDFDEEPCEHLLWLMDHILKQTIYDHDLTKPLKMTPGGYAEEMGDPFTIIAGHHLSILAEGIHCQLVTPDSEYDNEMDPFRALEARELLSSVYDTPPEEYRPDIFANPSTGKKIVKRHDLDSTVFRMLLDNHHFFHYFRSLCRPTDPINNLFMKLSQRVTHVLRDLDAYSAAQARGPTPAESPCDVPWAARHILGVVGLIRGAIYARDRPLSATEALSAARALVHTLTAVAARGRDAHPGPSRIDRNLYLRLVGDSDCDFVLGVLNLIPEAASHFVHNLEEIAETIGVQGAPASYVDKFRTLLGRLRASSTNSTLKRQVQGQGADRRSKRMK